MNGFNFHITSFHIGSWDIKSIQQTFNLFNPLKIWYPRPIWLQDQERTPQHAAAFDEVIVFLIRAFDEVIGIFKSTTVMENTVRNKTKHLKHKQ